MNGGPDDELHAELAGQMFGLRLVDLLDAYHVGVDLAQDFPNARQAHSSVEATAPMDVVRRHAKIATRGARGAMPDS
jgi:hypothetical protein